MDAAARGRAMLRSAPCPQMAPLADNSQSRQIKSPAPSARAGAHIGQLCGNPFPSDLSPPATAGLILKSRPPSIVPLQASPSAIPTGPAGKDRRDRCTARRSPNTASDRSPQRSSGKMRSLAKHSWAYRAGRIGPGPRRRPCRGSPWAKEPQGRRWRQASAASWRPGSAAAFPFAGLR